MRDGRKGGPAPKHRGAAGAARGEVRRKAERLVAETGIPRPMAFQVVRGQLTLNDALQRLALADKVDNLVRRYGFNKALATQIALGQADLDQALLKRRLAEWMAEHEHDSLLVMARDADRQVALAAHGGEVHRGRVVAVDKYEFDFAPKKGEPGRIHKVTLRWGCWAEHFAKVKSQVRVDPEGTGPVEPRFRPQDRYGLSDRRLFGYMESGARLEVAVLEGERFTGTVEWMSRWEFGLKLKRGVSVVIFRHALAGVEER